MRVRIRGLPDNLLRSPSGDHDVVSPSPQLVDRPPGGLHDSGGYHSYVPLRPDGEQGNERFSTDTPLLRSSTIDTDVAHFIEHDFAGFGAADMLNHDESRYLH